MILCLVKYSEIADTIILVTMTRTIYFIGTESWLGKDTTTSEMLPPEYQVLRKDRNSKARGGGVFIAVRKHYDMTLLPDFLTNCEILWAKVQISASKSRVFL